MKRIYEIPEMEIVCVEMENTIRTSTGLTDGGTGNADRNDNYDASNPGLWGN